MSAMSQPDNDQASLMAEMELDALRREIADLKREIDDLHNEADLDSCHIAGLSAQIKALLAESQACPHTEHHPLVQIAEYVDSRTGQTVSKTKALPLYREAFDEEARACGIEQPERYRG
jgi:uncharacterized protein YigA (DUF484 family)